MTGTETKPSWRLEYQEPPEPSTGDDGGKKSDAGSIKVGDYVKVISLRAYDEEYGINVGETYPVVSVTEDGEGMYIKTSLIDKRVMFSTQVTKVTPPQDAPDALKVGDHVEYIHPRKAMNVTMGAVGEIYQILDDMDGKPVIATKYLNMVDTALFSFKFKKTSKPITNADGTMPQQARPFKVGDKVIYKREETKVVHVPRESSVFVEKERGWESNELWAEKGKFYWAVENTQLKHAD